MWTGIDHLRLPSAILEHFQSICSVRNEPRPSGRGLLVLNRYAQLNLNAYNPYTLLKNTLKPPKR